MKCNKSSFYMKYLVVLVLVVIVLIAPGCLSCIVEQEIEISLAPIHDVQVNIAESDPPQVSVYIKGGLPDSCTTPYRYEVKRGGDTIDIDVYNQRPKDVICAQVYSYFEENVDLGSDFVSGQSYTININDKTTTFIMQ